MTSALAKVLSGFYMASDIPLRTRVGRDDQGVCVFFCGVPFQGKIEAIGYSLSSSASDRLP